MVKSEELRSKRQKLFEQCLKVNSFQKLLAAEIVIATEIRMAEVLLRSGVDKKLVQFHIQRLRLYGDGLVWLVLHAHVIRQMAKNPDVPKSLLQQGDAFDLVLKLAQDYFKRIDVPVLIADITNMLKIGDLIIVTDTEAPVVVESKKSLPRPEHLLQGRRGRQISKAIGTIKYLENGCKKVFGDDHYRLVVESETITRRNWDVVDRVCKDGLQNDWAEAVLSQHEVMWAYRKSMEGRLESEILALSKISKEGSTKFFGRTLGLMNMTDGLFPPPGVWPVSADVRFALLEEDLVLAHLLDAGAFECIRDTGESIKIDRDHDYPVLVTIGGRTYPLSLKFIYDVLYGYESVENCVEGLFEFAQLLHEMSPPEIAKITRAKPIIYSVDTIEEAGKIASIDGEREGDLVAVASDVFAHLNKRKRNSESKSDTSFLVQGARCVYAIVTVRDLRRLL
ncbi:MAG: hypothetical protein ACE5KK_02665 [Candidatus Brocadiales bacterium]